MYEISEVAPNSNAESVRMDGSVGICPMFQATITFKMEKL